MKNRVAGQQARKARKTALLATLVGLAGSYVPAHSQESAPTAEDSAESGLGEVLVSARRREESMQDVPLSITALSQEALRENGISTFNDLQYLVPSMTLVNGASRNEQFVSIRGISGLATDGQAVISYLNEVPLPQSANGGTGGGGPGLFFDLENVQVLKGPQGTLFGRNTLGGAILYQTKRPTQDLDGYVEATLGNYGDRQLQGALNIPINEKLLTRVAFNGIERDGLTKSLGTADHPGGNDLDNRRVFSARGTVTFQPTDTVKNELFYTYVRNHDHGSSLLLSYLDPAGLALAIFPELADVLAQQQALGIRKQVATDGAADYQSTYKSVIDIFSYQPSDSLTFRNIASHSDFSSLSQGDFDGSPFPIIQTGNLGRPFKVRIITEEPQLLGTYLGGRLVTTIGGYYENRPRQPAYRVHSVVFGGDRIRETAGYLGTDAESYAGYAHAAYDLAAIEGLKLTAGYRYSWDKQSQSSRRGLDANGECLTPGPQCEVSGRAEFSGANWNIGLDYQLAPRTLLYLVGRHGYHSGGLNLGVPGAANASYQPETGTDVELGLKTDWQIGELQGRTNVAVYNFQYDDVQTLEIVDNGDGTFGTAFGNATGARTWGAELEATVIPTRNLEISAQFDWLDFKYTDFGPGVDREQLERETLQNRPRYKYGVGTRYHLPMAAAIGDISFMARWSWQDETVISAFLAGPSPLQDQKAYGLLTLGAYWNDLAGKPLDVQLYMNNALDKNYKTGGYLFSAAFGTDSLAYGEPRTYGVKLRYRFGD